MLLFVQLLKILEIPGILSKVLEKFWNFDAKSPGKREKTSWKVLIPHGWMEEDEGMTFWVMLSYPDIFIFLMFCPSELGRKDLSDYMNSKV